MELNVICFAFKRLSLGAIQMFERYSALTSKSLSFAELNPIDPDGNWQKRDEGTGHFMSVKDDGEPFKGVAKEPDGRDTPNA